MIPDFRDDGYLPEGLHLATEGVTAKPEPDDVDAVVWLAGDFVQRVVRGDMEAIELETMLLTRRPEEIFAAEDRRDWDDWVEGRRKGIVEVEL